MCLFYHGADIVSVGGSFSKISDPRWLKFTLLYYIYVVARLILSIDYLIDIEWFLSKKVRHLIYLVASPQIKYRKISQKSYFFVFFSILNFHQAISETCPIQHCKIASFKRNNCSCSRLILQKCFFSEWITSFKPSCINKPIDMKPLLIRINFLFEFFLFIFPHFQSYDHTIYKMLVPRGFKLVQLIQFCFQNFICWRIITRFTFKFFIYLF